MERVFEAVYEREHAVGFRWLHETFGGNSRMTEMQAAIGRIQLKRMDDWHKKRLDNAVRIWDAAKKMQDTKGSSNSRLYRTCSLQMLCFC